jgi:hypothetical protein
MYAEMLEKFNIRYALFPKAFFISKIVLFVPIR